MKKYCVKSFFKVLILFALILFCSSCNELNIEKTEISKIKIVGLGGASHQVYSMLIVPESEVSNVYISGENKVMIDDEILNKMLEYKEEGYMSVASSAIDINVNNTIDVSGLNDYNYKVLVYINDFNMYIITHDLQYYRGYKDYGDILKDDTFTIDISYYLSYEYGPAYYHDEQNYYTYREFPNYFAYLKSLDPQVIIKCAFSFLLRVIACVIIALLFGFMIFRNMKILKRVFIINLILQTIADYFVFTNNDWGMETFLILPVVVICMAMIEIVILLKFQKTFEIRHYKWKVYLFSVVSNIVAFICNGMLYNVLPHLDW